MVHALVLSLVFVQTSQPAVSLKDLWFDAKRLTDEGPSRAEDATKALKRLRDAAEREKDGFVVVYAIWQLGRCEEFIGDLSKAQEYYKQAYEAARKSEEGGKLLPYVQRDYGHVSRLLWDNETAILHIEQALKGLRSKFKDKDVKTEVNMSMIIHTELDLVHALFQSQEQERGRKLLQSVLQEIPENRPKGEFDPRRPSAENVRWLLLENVALVLESGLKEWAGNTLEAVADFRKRLAHLESLDARRLSDPGVAIHLEQTRFNMRLQLARWYWKLFRFPDAETVLRKAEKELPKGLGPQIDMNTHWGYHSRDLARFLLSVEPANTKTLKKLDDGKQFLGEALALISRLKATNSFFKAETHLAIAECRSLAASYHRLNKDPELALREEQSADESWGIAIGLYEALWPRAKDHDIILIARRNHALSLIELGKLADARNLAADAMKAFKAKKRSGIERDFHPDLVEFYRVLVKIEERAGDFKAAAAYARDLRQVSARGLAPYLSRLSAPEQMNFLRQWDAPSLQACLRLGLEDRELVPESAEWLINGKARSAEVTSNIHRILRGAGQDVLNGYRQWLAEQACLIYGGESPSQDQAVLEKVIRLEGEKRNRVADLTSQANRHEENWVGLKRVRGLLRPGEAFIDVFRMRKDNGEARYRAWITTQSRVALADLGDADSIDAKVEAFQKRMNVLGNQKEFRNLGERASEWEIKQAYLKPLGEAILKPLLAELKEETKWVVCPDDRLWYLPWAALILPGTDRYAVEAFTIRYVGSGRELIARSIPSAPSREPWLLADPDLNAATKAPSPLRKFSLSRLKIAADEGLAVARALESLHPFLAPESTTKDQLLQLQGSPRFILLSTHAFHSTAVAGQLDAAFQFDPMLSAGVVFAGYNRVSANKDITLPGLLTAAEVLGKDFSGTELVVLSACQTGVGKLVQGQGPTDVRAAFRLAGARSVVSTLWNTDELGSRQVVGKLFVNTRSGEDFAARLRSAQLEAMAEMRKFENHAHPYYWASFTLSGP